jgi:PAS domain S-box-containing protein
MCIYEMDGVGTTDEDRLRQTERMLRLTIQTIPVFIVTALPDGTVDFVSPRFTEFTGLSEAEWLGAGWLNATHPDDRDGAAERWQLALSAGEPFELETRLRRADGSYRWFLGRAVPLRDETGHVVKWYATATDIEDRKRSEEKLRRSEAYLRDVQRLVHMGSVATNVSSGAFTASPEFLRIFGYDPDRETPTVEALRQRIHPEDVSSVRHAAETGRQRKTAYVADYRVVLPDGTIRHCHVVAHPVLDDAGEVTEYISTTVDVSERVQADEALRQAQAELARVHRVTTMGELLASLAHEVNQPITAAIASANACVRFLNRDQPDLEEARAAARSIVQDETRAADIISRIRQIFTKDTTQPRAVDINDVIRGTIVLLAGEATRHGIAMRTELAADLPPAAGDPVQLQQVMMNLILNGVDALSDVQGSRELTIASQRAEHGELLVSVIDTGVGLPPQVDEIFKAFFTTKPHGIGMGLSISRSIVEAHGGHLWASGNWPRGARFSFTLPTIASQL